MVEESVIWMVAILALAILLSSCTISSAHAGTICQTIGNQIFCTTTATPYQPPVHTTCTLVGQFVFCN